MNVRAATSLASVLALSCLSSPTAPETDVRIATDYGTVAVWSDGSSYDLSKIRAALERGQRRALDQRPDAPSLDGLTVAVYRHQVWQGVDSVGAYDADEDTALGLAGIEEVYDHEIQHRAAHLLGLRGECLRLQDHSPGFNLWCRAR